MKVTGCIVVALISVCSSFGQRLNLPEPPHQRTPWPPPAGVPTNLLSAVKTLFEQGFPDPRGCEYREIEVEVSGVWGGKTSLAQTRGWVVPGKSWQTPRFAICWNGLIYPVAKVGAAADLHTEAASLIPPGGRRFNNALGEVRSVVSTNSLSTRVLLMLRCSETEAALKNWVTDERLALEMGAGKRGSAPGDAKTNSYDPYLQFAGDWVWALFDRTISAHTRGDAPLALATARKLAELQPQVEAEAAKRGFPRQKFYDSARQGKEKPHIDFLEQLPQLLADLERRAREGKRVSVINSGLTNIANQIERITALIRDLDLVQARQWGQPGSVNLGEDPIVDSLIREGDAAVEPLLDCLETDKRLTRSVGFGRDFHRGRTVIPVASAARTALNTILHASFGSAVEMRAYWKKYGALKLEERWYAILSDNDAGMGRWQEAAANITQPENIRTFPGTGFSMESPAPTNAPVKLRGESLRSKTNPPVAELMARRATEVSPTNIAGYDLTAACEIALRLAAWDIQFAGPTARALVERYRAATEYSEQRHSWPEQRLATLVAKLTCVRAQSGDARAFEDYAAWLQTTTPEQLESYLGDSLEPLRKFSTNEVLRSGAESLFSETNSAWGRLPWKRAGLFNPIESELVHVPAFRRLLSRELDRKEMCGFIEWRGPNTASFQVTNYLSGSRGLALPESDRPASGMKGELRWCDWIAWSLSNAKQIPLFNPFATVERRDKAIKDAKATLNQP